MIADYAMLGDCHSAALVARDGTVEWLCWPDFDSPSVFGAMLDRGRGGRFVLRPVDPFETRRRYLPNTNVLENTFETEHGRVRILDFLAIEEGAHVADPPSIEAPHVLVRIVEGVGGRVRLRLHCEPRPGYGRELPEVRRIDATSFDLVHASLPLRLVATFPLRELDEGDGVAAEYTIGTGERQAVQLFGGAHAGTPRDATRMLAATAGFWRAWTAQCRQAYGRYQPYVVRSALALKAMAYAPSGAIVAAPTTSLPEQIGARRNWDYRFCWLRDATFTIAALHEIGFAAEAEAFYRWLTRTIDDARDPVAVMCGLHGENRGDERELDHLSGYRDSRPVRIGNAAASQLQLDTLGEIADAIFLCQRLFQPEPSDVRIALRLADAAARRWREPDQGIWEVRSGRFAFVYSKVMCWVALSRALDLMRDGDRIDVARSETWQRAREAIERDILARGFDPGRGTFVTAYDQPGVDAALLRLPLVGFVRAEDPRMVGTVRRVRDQLGRGALLRRYDTLDDGLESGEGAFALCTAWMVENLCLQGRRTEAEELFEELLSKTNDVGLLAEQIDPDTGLQLGNMPQGFTHVGIIRAAVRLAGRELRPDLRDARGPIPPPQGGMAPSE